MAHTHLQDPQAHCRAFKIGIALNGFYVLLEAAGGIVLGSLALLSDAAHNLGDVFALALAGSAAWLSRAAPSERRTYGMKRATVLASLVSAVLLCLAFGGITWESIARLAAPLSTNRVTIDGISVMVIAALGVVINAATAAMFLSGRHADLNVRSAFLHMSADAAVSLGVVIAGLVILLTGWSWVDPVIALVIAVLILVGGFALLRESLDLAMDAVPRHIDVREVRAFLESRPGISDVHHLHIWGMSTTETAMTVHLVAAGGRLDESLLRSIAETMKHDYGIQHPTIQVEEADGSKACVYT